MSKSLREKLNALPEERRKKIEAGAAELIAREMTLRDLRKARQLTQERIAECLNIGQDNVSRIEKRSDLLVSTLRSYVEAMGGELHVTAKFPNRPAVELVGFASMENERRKKKEEARV
jgi:transcriptional regulator with XRE-family HTH domain